MLFGARSIGESSAIAARIVLGAFLAVLPAVTPAAPLTYSWIGSASNAWSNPNNWNPVGTPTGGDSLAFPLGAPYASQNNDLAAGTVFNILQFNAQGYQLGGNAIGLSGKISGGTNNTFNLPITLAADASFDGGTYNAAVDLGPFVLTLGSGMGVGQINFNGPVSGTNRIELGGMGSPTFSGTHPFSGLLVGNVWLDGGAFPNASIQVSNAGYPGAMLQGNGTVGGSATLTYVAPGSKSMPGLFSFDRPGTLSIGGDVALTTTSMMTTPSMSFDIDSGSSYDQLNVGGTLTLPPSALLYVNLNPTFVPTVGQVFTLVRNQRPVSGVFGGMPEGSTLAIGPYRFRLSYLGNNANDITLTCTLAPNVWTGAIDNLWSTAGNWTGGVPGPGSALTFPAGAMRTLTTNDLPAGTTFASVSLGQPGYQMGGNAIGLTGNIAGGTGNTFNVPISLSADASFDGGTFNGAIDLGAHVLTLGNGMGVGQINFNAPVSGSNRIELGGMGSPTFSAPNPFSGVLVGNVWLDGGSFPNASMQIATAGYPGAMLQGNGTLGGSAVVTYLNPGSKSMPGLFSFDRPGVLNVGGDLTLTTTTMSSTPSMGFDIDNAGSYDQLNIGGTLNIPPTAMLNVYLNVNFVPTVGQVFTLIHNQHPVNGTFSGLPEGATIALGLYRFQLSYAGNGANDVTLTCTVAPNVWTGAVDNLWSTPGNWTGGVPAPGSALTFPPSARTSTTNDLAAGTVFSSIAFTSLGYQLGGNAIGLAGNVTGAANNTFNLPISITVDASFDGGTFNAPLDLGAHVLTLGSGFGAGQTAFNGPVSGTNRMELGGMGSPTFSGTHPFSGTLVGNVWLDNATLPNASMQLATSGYPGAMLQGNGTIGRNATVSYAYPGSKSMPGLYYFDRPGQLNVGGDLTLSATLFGPPSMSFRINGNAPGIGYDQLTVGGVLTLPANSNLYVNMSPSWVPTKGETYILVDHRGSGPINGIFANMPEGAIVTLLSVYNFRLSYVGGDGNDIVLVSLNGKDPTNTMLVSSANPSVPGQSVTFTATVIGNDALHAPTGNVTFRDDTTVLAFLPLFAGSVTYSTSTLLAGAHNITAQYEGDAYNGGSTSPVVVQTVSVVGSTPSGTDVPVAVNTTLPSGGSTTIDLQFDNVTSAGTTTVTATTGGPTPPSGYQLGNPPVYYDVVTTAGFSGNVTLCFGWTEGQFTNEGAIALWHYENGLWQNVTTLLDPVNNQVCGRVTSLSPFALMEQHFTFSGFYAPVANAPAFNAVKAGSSVPIKFSLGGDYGLNIVSTGYPASSPMACGSSASNVIGDATSTAGNSALSYDAASGQYTYVWKTDKAWQGTCRQFSLRLTDGTERRANFDFR